MHVSELKTLSQRIQKLHQQLAKSDGGGLLHESYDDGLTVTWRFDNVASPQEIQERVETLAIWLWSFKDYLKAHIKATGGTENVVETYVNSCRYLPLCADIANSAKHGNLGKSRSGRFARIAETVITVRSGMSLRQAGDKTGE